MALPQSFAATPATRGGSSAEAPVQTLGEVLTSCALTFLQFRSHVQSNKGPLTAQVLRENTILRLMIARVRRDAECLEMMASVPHK